MPTPVTGLKGHAQMQELRAMWEESQEQAEIRDGVNRTDSDIAKLISPCQLPQSLT